MRPMRGDRNVNVVLQYTSVGDVLREQLMLSGKRMRVFLVFLVVLVCMFWLSVGWLCQLAGSSREARVAVEWALNAK